MHKNQKFFQQNEKNIESNVDTVQTNVNQIKILEQTEKKIKVDHKRIKTRINFWLLFSKNFQFFSKRNFSIRNAKIFRLHLLAINFKLN